MRGSRVLHVPNLLCLPFLSLTLKLKQKSVTSTVPFETYKQLHPTLSLFHSNYAFRHIHTDTFSFSLRKLCYTLPTSKVCRTCIHWSGELPCRYNNFDFSGFNSLSFFFFFWILHEYLLLLQYLILVYAILFVILCFIRLLIDEKITDIKFWVSLTVWYVWFCFLNLIGSLHSQWCIRLANFFFSWTG